MTSFESCLMGQVSKASQHAPSVLEQAMHYAMFPGGGRVRPKLAMAIVEAYGKRIDDVVLGAAMAVEMMHCASLVHDDLPCFDDAETRRGKPSVHRAFGEDTALLVGDALIVAAFDVLAKFCAARPEIIGPMIRFLAEAVGASQGLIAGQASESDPGIDVQEVHRKKTGALFEAAAGMAALAAGEETAPWRHIGQNLGMAYQLADDILDTVGDGDLAGKPVAQDMRHGRPNALNQESLEAAVTSLDNLIERTINRIPPCPGMHDLAMLLAGLATRLCPPEMIPRNSSLMASPYLAGSPAIPRTYIGV